MRKKDRLAQIRAILEQNGQVNVLTLSSELSVSGVTIRSDLETLEQEGFAVRTHGGAVLRERDSSSALDPFSDGIRKVAQLAAARIEDHSWIFLGSGGTCLAVAAALAEGERSVNVLTNSIPIADLAARSSSLNIQLTGGSVHRSRYPFVYGDRTLTALEGVTVDQAFIGVAGIDLNFGLSVTNEVERGIFSRVHAAAKEALIVADHTKFDKRTFMKIADLFQVTGIITDGDVPAPYLPFCIEPR